jgi:hypothetical protein
MRDPLDSGTNMATANDASFPPFDLPPWEKACFGIIVDYQEGRLSLEEAAPRLQAAFRANPQGHLNMDVGPSLRRLLAEVARLDGHPAPFLGPDPNRHADGGRRMLEHLIAQAWRDVSSYPRSDQPLSISIHFAAATETTAQALVTWLRTHGNHHVRLTSPAEADSDDWLIHADTPSTHWTQAAVTQWARSLRTMPLAGEASFTGWSL